MVHPINHPQRDPKMVYSVFCSLSCWHCWLHHFSGAENSWLYHINIPRASEAPVLSEWSSDPCPKNFSGSPRTRASSLRVAISRRNSVPALKAQEPGLVQNDGNPMEPQHIPKTITNRSCANHEV